MPSKRPSATTLLGPIPNVPGVYLFYGVQDELLYVGKSKTLKARVRAHFRDRSERMMMGRVRRIEIRETAGELGALLLESRLIKELKPMFNRAQRQRRRIVIAERRMTPKGYLTVHLRSVDAIDPRKSGEILGVFKHTTQAKEFLESAVKERRLCPVLLGLEQGRRVGEIVNRESSIVNRKSTIGQFRPCFSYHLGHCSGACIGEEPPESYNPRVEGAFGERRILAWPYGGPLVIRERRRGVERRRSPGGEQERRGGEEEWGSSRGEQKSSKGAKEERSSGRWLEEVFLVDNWVLVGSLTRTGAGLTPFVAANHRFDYDTYKILRAFIDDPPPVLKVRVAPPEEWARLVRSTEHLA